ncbi:major facilitator superfamily domain-containing protein [Fimicolochytrium jonesii]|uniref:major facilitator superfamily domain-containing protein n=1 Tax=Fimicolochytrium jonesii TaxID=1396493 RepID=UPI0022FEE436|nr:major facilitator superfamily domain-containing protein [Fimicolochytrium jonesii]KAI8824008.1 major facilitator superfamily domain-containing protein [Fimicolochytrium jonesii]
MPTSAILQELGLTTILHAARDIHLLLLSKFLRMFAYGASTLILAVYFSALGHSDEKIGLFMTLTLLGDVIISLFLTVVADSLGRRRILVLSCGLMMVSGVVFALTDNYYILLVAAIVGVISPSGNEIGPFRAVEESTLAHLSSPATRSDVFAWYVVVGTLGAAGGSLGAGWVVQVLGEREGWTGVEAYRAVFWGYAVVGFVKGCVAMGLGEGCEPARVPEVDEERRPLLGDGAATMGPTTTSPAATTPTSNPPPPDRKGIFSHLSPATLTLLLKISLIFSIDSLASGMVPTSLVAYFLDTKFQLPKSQLGSILSTASFTASLGNIAASSISKRIGLVPTMVFTHLPSAIFLALFPFPSSIAVTLVFLFARASLASMDQAPRTTFLSIIILPAERTAVMGIVNTVKTCAQSGGPVITGYLAANGRFWVAFVVAGVLKASYDLGMLGMFLGVKGREEEVVRETSGETVGEEEEEEVRVEVDVDGDAGVERRAE